MAQMTHWRLLDCPKYEEINSEIQNYIHDIGLIEKTESFWNPIEVVKFVTSCPKFKNYLVKQNLLIKSLAVTVGKNKNCCGPHIDSPPARFKLSWPIENTRDTYTRWFEPLTDNPSIVINDLGGTSFQNFDELREISRLETLRPSIIDAGIPHDVYIGPGAVLPRIGLQCQLIKEPESL